MSLLDDVSIVVTPNGYKAGELYAVIPVPTLGAELMNCSSFDCADPAAAYNEGSGWTFSGGKAIYDGTGGTSQLAQSNVIEVGKQYKVIVEVLSNEGSGQNTLYLGGTILSTANLSVGTHVFYGVTNNSSVTVTIYGRNGEVFEIGSISVKEYTSADMDVTRNTAATRVDENGLVNYAEVLGGEEVTNGDFATDSDWEFYNVDSNTNTRYSGSSAILEVIVSQFTRIKSIGYNAMVVGVAYKITYDVLATDGSALGIQYPSTNVSSALGTHSYYIIATNSSIAFSKSTVGSVTIDNISVKEVTRDNVPRIDYTGGGCPHILAEPMRTNLITYSEAFDNAYWTKSGATVESGFTSPDGTANAFKLVEDTSTGNHFSSKGNVFTADGNTRGFSIFVKEGERRYIFITNVNTINNDINCVVFDTRDGVFTNTNDTTYILSRNVTALENSWYRIDFTSNTNSGAYDNFFVGISSSGTMSGASYTGDGTSGVYIYGAQVEGSYATSYIPNFGTAAGVTRNQDIFTRDGIGSLINSTEGVLFVEMAALDNDGTFRQLTLSDGTTANRILVDFTDASNQIRVFCGSGGVSQVSETFNVTSSLSFNKIAFKYKLNDFALWVNGVEVATDTSGITPIGLNKLSFNNGAGSFDFYGKVKQLQVYDTSLSDEQLLQLTGESGTDFYESYAEMASALTYTIQ